MPSSVLAASVVVYAAVALGLSEGGVFSLSGQTLVLDARFAGLAGLPATLPRFATVKKFTLLPREFSEAEGEVTPSQKLKRKAIEQKHREALDAIVQGDRAGWRARGAAHVDLRFEKVDRRVLLTGSATAELTAECGRCLKPITADVPVDFTRDRLDAGNDLA